MVTEEFRDKISSRIVALELLDYSKYINRAYESIIQKRYTLTSAKESPVFKNKSYILYYSKNDQKCLSKIKLNCLRDPSDMNEN
jgi:hypothetical protein